MVFFSVNSDLIFFKSLFIPSVLKTWK